MHDSNLDRTLIFVCGAARSGTTMLDLMLGNSHEAFSCGEMFCYFRPWRAHHFEPVCSCGESPCKVWAKIGECTEDQFHARVFERLDVRFVVDSSKDLRWVLDGNVWAQDASIPVANVLIWKTPKSLAYSHWKRGRPVGAFRRHFLNYYERFLRLRLPFISVAFEELVSDPARVLEALADNLGMTYEPGLEQFWEKQHHHYFGSAGTTRQARAGESAIRSTDDFPEEFLHAYERFMDSRKGDERLEAVTDEIRERDFSQIRKRVPAVPLIDPGRPRPVWYYRHSLKAIFRRRFPEPAVVVD